jgi:hypothetical protein
MIYPILCTSVLSRKFPSYVIPAPIFMGINCGGYPDYKMTWIPAFAGMTADVNGIDFINEFTGHDIRKQAQK